jgi:endonuclease/exonuclease/phosphatase family metal-dependent hydrolase
MQVSQGAGRQDLDLTAMSFNVRHCEGSDGVLDVARIARVIRASGADVIGLQEVDRHFGDRSNWEDQAEELGRLLSFDVCYGANQDLGAPARGRPSAQYGTALLSRYPIRRWKNTHLFRSPAGEQRGVLHAEIEVHNATLHFFNVHLEWLEAADRKRQAEQVVALIGSTGPSVLLGDFNSVPQSREIEILRAAFTDCWSLLDGGPMATYPADVPAKCIDYVFAGPGVTPMRVQVITEDPVASDHLPVLARLTVAATRTPSQQRENGAASDPNRS